MSLAVALFRQEMERESPAWVWEREAAYVMDVKYPPRPPSIYTMSGEDLSAELKRLNNLLRDSRMDAGRFILRLRKRKDRDEAAAILNTDDLEDRIRKIKKQLEFRDIPKTEDTITEAHIERAKMFPLWKLLDKKPKQKVICPFHRDKKPSLYLYEVHGYCFPCAKAVNAVDWIMQTRGIPFLVAVRELNRG